MLRLVPNPDQQLPEGTNLPPILRVMVRTVTRVVSRHIEACLCEQTARIRELAARVAALEAEVEEARRLHQDGPRMWKRQPVRLSDYRRHDDGRLSEAACRDIMRRLAEDIEPAVIADELGITEIDLARQLHERVDRMTARAGMRPPEAGEARGGGRLREIGS